MLHSEQGLMQAAQITARGTVTLVETPIPKLQPGYALIRTTHLSLCGSDIRMIHYSADVSYPFPPGTTGHEMVGIVAEISDPGVPFEVGQRVLALAPDHCAMAQYYLAPNDLVIPLPSATEGTQRRGEDIVPSEVLLQAQQLGTVIYAAQRLPNMIGKSVAVIGQGSAGLWFNLILRQMGARQVIAVDQDETRLSHAMRFGASGMILHDPENPTRTEQLLADCCSGTLADVVIEAAGDPPAINLAIALVKKFGEILFFGVPRCQMMSFNMEQFFRKCCRSSTIVGATEEHGQHSTQMAIDMIQANPSLAASLITHRYPLQQVATAYEMHRTRANRCLKIVIEME